MIGVTGCWSREQRGPGAAARGRIGGDGLEPLAVLSRMNSRGTPVMASIGSGSRKISRSACSAARRLCPPSGACSVRGVLR